jgi:hypothetical protein
LPPSPPHTLSQEAHRLELALCSVVEPAPQAQVSLLEQPPPPDIRHKRAGALVQHKGCGSLIEILGGHSDSGVARTQGVDFQERCPQFA